tara:strand:- start:15633 stop:16628 length:996 start_codon:yes stop_codon:yes gene_type:complete
MADKKIWTDETFSDLRKGRVHTVQSQLESAEEPIVMIPGDSGLAHTQVQRPIVNYIDAPNQLTVNTDNASIVLGSDRPSTLVTGKGAVGAQNAATIDMVVGRMSSANEGSGPEDGAFVNPSFGSDAARIYISQLTDVDLNFGIADGNLGSVTNRSAVALKADSVRIIGRSGGVKIVTGRSPAFKGMGNEGETNSLGGSVPVAPPIELIAGNNDGSFSVPAPLAGIGGEDIKYLQGVARGGNTRDALKDLGNIVEELIGAIYNLSLIQKQFNNVLGVTPIYPHAAAAPVVSQMLGIYQNALWQTRINKIMWEVNHLETFGYKYICSKNVYST